MENNIRNNKLFSDGVTLLPETINSNFSSPFLPTFGTVRLFNLAPPTGKE